MSHHARAATRRELGLVLLAAALVAASRFALRARLPDDYDAIGFVAALDDFDLARLQPHVPGYPVYVALGRVVHALGAAPLAAACGVSALAAGATALGLWRLGRRLAGARAAWLALALYAGAMLPWVLGGAALSDSTATAFAVAAFAALAGGRMVLGGVLAGLMLGARLSYAPLALSWLGCAWPSKRALGGLAAGTLAWSVPFFAIVGVGNFFQLGVTHLAGHFTVWGGSIHTRPGLLMRAGALARALWFDGLAPSLLAAVLLAALALLAVVALAARRPAVHGRGLALGVWIAAPYALWVWLGQNIVEQPRHALPLVVALILGLALLMPTAIGALAVALVLFAGAPLAWRHATTLPAAAQAALSLPAAPPAQLLVFGGRSIRFFGLLAPSLAVRERAWLSEVDVDLERVDPLPARILVTSEVEADPVRAPRLRPAGTFCRDARLDRQQPCLQLYEYSLGAVP